MRWAPAASAWPRSTRATWSTWRARWPRSAADPAATPMHEGPAMRGLLRRGPARGKRLLGQLGRHERRYRVAGREGLLQRLVLVAVLVPLALLLLGGRGGLPLLAGRRRVLAVSVGHALPRGLSGGNAHACARPLKNA